MKLCICGNGFDLHHGLQTSYKCYKEFLNNKYSNIIKEYEEFVGVNDDGRIAWTNIENALKVDYLKIFSRYADLPSVIDEVYYRSHDNDRLDNGENDLKDAFEGLTYFITNFTGIYLYEWLSSIDIKHTTPDLDLNPNDLYINFNYLDTLQTLYNIRNKNVFHIHGAIKNLRGLKKNTAAYKRDCMEMYVPEVGRKEALDIWRYFEGPSFQNMFIRQELQFGAVIDKEKELKRLKIWYHSDEAYAEYVEPSIRVFEDFIEKSTKELSKNYSKLIQFLYTHDDINTVVIMGHTMGGLDYPYYEDILVPFFGNKLWVFKAHNGNTKAIEEFTKKANIKNYEIETW